MEEVEKETAELYGKSPQEITAIRGRLIRKIKQEIKKIKAKGDLSAEEQNAIEELERRLNDLLADHKAQLSDRYDKEFIKQEADLKSLVTVLPKAVGLSAKKVGTCINELIEAKTNKSRIFKSIELLKALGLFAATPVIYTAKFIANHWYLIFLLLLLIKLPKFGFNFGGKGKNQNDPQFQGEPETEAVTVPEEETENVLLPKPDTETVPGILPQPEPEPENQPVPTRYPRPRPGLVPKPGLVPHMQTDTGTGDLPVPQPKTEPAPNAIDYNTDPRFQVKPESSPIPEIVPELSEESLKYAQEVYQGFFKVLNERNCQILIRDQYPNITYVHNAQEFIDYVHTIDPNIVIQNEQSALQLYEAGFPGMNPEIMNVYWINSGSPLDHFKYFESMQSFADTILSNEDEYLTNLFNDYVAGKFTAPIPFELNGVIGNMAEALGVSTGSALVLFLLYEGIQYGLAIPTGGLSLLAPG